MISKAEIAAENELFSFKTLMGWLCLFEAEVSLRKWMELAKAAGTFDEQKFQKFSDIINFLTFATKPVSID